MRVVLPSVKLNQTLIHDFLSGSFFFFEHTCILLLSMLGFHKTWLSFLLYTIICKHVKFHFLISFVYTNFMGLPGSSDGKDLPAMWKTGVQSLGWEDPLENRMATHSNILAWKIQWGCKKLDMIEKLICTHMPVLVLFIYCVDQSFFPLSGSFMPEILHLIVRCTIYII